MNLTIEQMALIGDKEAQKKILEKKEPMSCPWCGAPMKLIPGSAHGWYKTKCLFCRAESPQQDSKIIALQGNIFRAPILSKEEIIKIKRILERIKK